MLRFKTKQTYKFAYGTMDLSLDEWTPSSHSIDTEHLAVSYVTIAYCVVSCPLSDMASSHCLATNTLLPPQWWVLPCCIHDITPFLSHWDSAWHADNAHFLAPNIGESRIREWTSVFSLTIVPRIPPIIMDQCQLVMGIFLCLRLLNSQFVRHLGIWQHGYL